MDNRKEQIMEAAKTLFNRLGYGKTSVDDIARAVGMQKSSLYYYYRNKEELFCSAYISDWDNTLRDFRDIAQREKSPSERILKYISKSLGHYEKVVLQHKIPMRIIVETRNIFLEVFDEINEKSFEFYKEKIQEGIREGIYKKVNIDEVARAILTTKTSIQYDNFMHLINQEPGPEQFNEINRKVLFTVRLMLEGIKK